MISSAHAKTAQQIYSLKFVFILFARSTKNLLYSPNLTYYQKNAESMTNQVFKPLLLLTDEELRQHQHHIFTEIPKLNKKTQYSSILKKAPVVLLITNQPTCCIIDNLFHYSFVFSIRKAFPPFYIFVFPC